MFGWQEMGERGPGARVGQRANCLEHPLNSLWSCFNSHASSGRLSTPCDGRRSIFTCVSEWVSKPGAGSLSEKSHYVMCCVPHKRQNLAKTRWEQAIWEPGLSVELCTCLHSRYVCVCTSCTPAENQWKVWGRPGISLKTPCSGFDLAIVCPQPIACGLDLSRQPDAPYTDLVQDLQVFLYIIRTIRRDLYGLVCILYKQC